MLKKSAIKGRRIARDDGPVNHDFVSIAGVKPTLYASSPGESCVKSRFDPNYYVHGDLAGQRRNEEG